jgi:asparagine synthase (glutamine-hydrolysing)
VFRYLMLIWNPSEQRSARTAQGLAEHRHLRSPRWQEVMSDSAVRVFCADARQSSLGYQLLADGKGVILGTLFRRNETMDDDTPCRAAQLSAQESASVQRTCGRWLLEHCWGNYVAVLGDRSSGATRILRDPTSTLPCFYTAFKGVQVVFSCVSDCIAIGLPRFTIAEQYLCSQVTSGGHANSQSALRGVSPVHRGECIEIAPARTPALSTQLYWTPERFFGAECRLEDADQAARAIRATVRACTQAWASRHESILHRLSGGLDSSIISGCLKDTPTLPRVTSYTYYHPSGLGDPRPWSRLAATHAGWKHVECAVIPERFPLREALGMPPSVEPASALSFLHGSTLEQPLAAERQATAVFTGDGGDSGFCSSSIPHAAAEYLLNHGPRPRVIRLSTQVARQRGESTWGVLASAVRARLAGKIDDDAQTEFVRLACVLVNPELRARSVAVNSDTHPWLQASPQHLHAIGRRLGGLLYAPEFYSVSSGNARGSEVISPLHSQPVVELLLRIPAYVHFDGGVDRGLARRAFVREVPHEILRRQWKDRAPGFHAELVQRNLELLRTVFLDGVLVKQGLLDRDAMERTLSASTWKHLAVTSEIFRHLDTELWARQWSAAG